MNEEIKSIFGNNISVDGDVIPIAHIRYKGKSRKFVTWTPTGEEPRLSANDEPLYSVGTVEMDIFSNGNYLNIIKEIKKRMKDNEWIWTGDSPEMYEEDTGLYHKTISFEKERIL